MFLFTVYSDTVCMYCEHKDSIFIFLNRFLQESLVLEFDTILLLFLILNILIIMEYM